VFLAALVQFVGHREIVVGIDGAVPGRQIAHVPIGRQYLEVLPKVPVDGGRLGRRFYDQEFDVPFLALLKAVPGRRGVIETATVFY
jgi:hypothetical protein